MRVALDTNILVYAEGMNGREKRDIARALINRLQEHDIFLPVQALGELFQVLVRKGKLTRVEARKAVLFWRDTYPLVDTTEEVLLVAADLAVEHHIGFWDAVMLAAAAQAQCRLFLSEDLQDGFIWRGMTVANPFAPERHPLLEDALSKA